jgi:hypothetical protein
MQLAAAPAAVRPRQPKPTLSNRWASTVSLSSIAFTQAALVFSYVMLWGSPSLKAALSYLFIPTVFIPMLVVSLILHELLHALAWVEFGRVSWSAIRFGMKGLTLQARCQAPMQASAFRLGVALPAVILGIIPAFAGLGLSHGVLMAWGAIMLILSARDIATLWAIRFVPARARVMHR